MERLVEELATFGERIYDVSLLMVSTEFWSGKSKSDQAMIGDKTADKAKTSVNNSGPETITAELTLIFEEDVVPTVAAFRGEQIRVTEKGLQKARLVRKSRTDAALMNHLVIWRDTQFSSKFLC